MLKRTVLAALNPIRFIATTALAMIGGFLLLCACARQTPPIAATAGSPLSPQTAVSTSDRTLLPDPSPSVHLATRSPTPAPTIDDYGSSPVDLSIHGPGMLHIVPGETTVYTLAVRNDGPAPATGIVLTDTLPKGIVPVWTRPTQITCRRQGQSVSCDVGDLRASDAITVMLDLAIGGDETLMTGQPAGVTFSMPSCTIEPNTEQSLVTCRLPRLRPGAEAQVRVGFTASGPVTGTLVHTATVAANETDPDRSNNRASLTVIIVGAEKQEGSSDVDERPVAPDLILRAAGPSKVIAGQPFSRTFTITNTGSQEATGVHFESVLPLATILNAYTPGLPLCERRGDTFVCALRDPDSGKAITFTLLITGYDEQPVIVEPDFLMPGWPVCSVLKEKTFLHILTCDLGVLKPGQTTRVQMTLTAEGVQERVLENTASVSAREADPSPLNNSDTATMTVQVRSDLLVRSEVSGRAVAGETLRYTLTVVNAGPSDATGVVLVDTLPVPVGGPGPVGTSLISAVPDQGKNCRVEQGDASTDTLRCSLDRLRHGETTTVTVVVAVPEPLDPAATEDLIHSASVVSEQADPKLDNNDLTEMIPFGVEGKE